MPRALITGISGQDGHYLANFLNGKSYEVVGLVHERHPDTASMMSELPFVSFINGDLTDVTSLIRACDDVRPDEIYNLGSRSAVDLSFQTPLASLEATGLGVLNLLEAVRLSRNSTGPVRIYQASSAEMFGEAGPGPYSEQTQFRPQSPYAAAKILGHHIAHIYRDSYQMYISTGICFNHESPRRGHHFVSRKISSAVARIASGIETTLRLGNIDSRRDWGYAGDYVVAMWLTLQQSVPDDYVISTGKSHSVRDFLDLAFGHIGISSWEQYVARDPRYLRPLDVSNLVGDNSKARGVLGWKPAVDFRQLVEMMVDADIALLRGSSRRYHGDSN